MRLQDDRRGCGFRWRMVATGGTPWQGGDGFSNPDNLAIDRHGNVWLVTDRPTSDSGLNVFGNNACWVPPAAGPETGRALLFATGPMECELCGPCFDAEEHMMFLAVQHPGEENGPHRSGQEEIQAHTLRVQDNRPLEQLRRVLLGSNWPSGGAGRSPRPSVATIRRGDGRGTLL